MLPKINRADKKTIEKIFSIGKFVNSPNLSLKFFVSYDDKKNFLLGKKMSPQIAFITPKTISKKASTRNLLRKRGYAVFRKYLNTIPSGFSGVFIFSKKSERVFGGRKSRIFDPISNLENEIKIILNKINF